MSSGRMHAIFKFVLFLLLLERGMALSNHGRDCSEEAAYKSGPYFTCGRDLECDQKTKTCQCRAPYEYVQETDFCRGKRNYCDYDNGCSGSNIFCNFPLSKCECESGYEEDEDSYDFECQEALNLELVIAMSIVVVVIVVVVLCVLFWVPRALARSGQNENAQSVETPASTTTIVIREEYGTPNVENPASTDSNTPMLAVNDAPSMKQDMDCPPAYNVLFPTPSAPEL